MNAMKPSQWAALAVGVAFILYAIYSHFQYFGNFSFLGSILLVEIIIVSLWKYEARFLTLLLIAFVWAGMNVPMQSSWTGGRWMVLAAGAVAGCIIWAKSPRSHFKTMHLIAFFCVGAAFVSASVSIFVQMAAAKALSLTLLFLYCSSGAYLAVLGREERFFKGLVLACEIVAYGTAICYLGLGANIWGNPNALGLAMSVGVFPVLLWGWLTSDGPVAKTRRFVALVLSAYLVFFSMARASIIALTVVTVALCICLRQYKLLTRVFGFTLFIVALAGMLAPTALNEKVTVFKEAFLYKGHKDKGLLGSRMTPWEETIHSIKEHPLFGTGYGTSPTGEDPGLNYGRFASSAETVREHGSSYMTIAEWVGMLGIVPFLALLMLTFSRVWKVCGWMRQTCNPRHYSIPLAMVLLAGFVHAGFEDWLFAVGAYPCIYFWVFAFMLGELLPAPQEAPARAVSLSSARKRDAFVAVPNG